MDRPAIRTPNELYAHAIAIEREAAETYAELAQHMDELGNDEVATLFRRLAVFEAEHLQTLEARTAGVALPALKPGEYAWLDAGAPETVARELVYRLLTPRAALDIALDAERRAQQFFAGVHATADDPALRAHAAATYALDPFTLARALVSDAARRARREASARRRARA